MDPDVFLTSGWASGLKYPGTEAGCFNIWLPSWFLWSSYKCEISSEICQCQLSAQFFDNLVSKKIEFNENTAMHNEKLPDKWMFDVLLPTKTNGESYIILTYPSISLKPLGNEDADDNRI